MDFVQYLAGLPDDAKIHAIELSGKLAADADRIRVLRKSLDTRTLPLLETPASKEQRVSMKEELVKAQALLDQFTTTLADDPAKTRWVNAWRKQKRGVLPKPPRKDKGAGTMSALIGSTSRRQQWLSDPPLLILNDTSQPIQARLLKEGFVERVLTREDGPVAVFSLAVDHPACHHRESLGLRTTRDVRAGELLAVSHTASIPYPYTLSTELKSISKTHVYGESVVLEATGDIGTHTEVCPHYGHDDVVHQEEAFCVDGVDVHPTDCYLTLGGAVLHPGSTLRCSYPAEATGNNKTLVFTADGDPEHHERVFLSGRFYMADAYLYFRSTKTHAFRGAKEIDRIPVIGTEVHHLEGLSWRCLRITQLGGVFFTSDSRAASIPCATKRDYARDVDEYAWKDTPQCATSPFDVAGVPHLGCRANAATSAANCRFRRVRYPNARTYAKGEVVYVKRSFWANDTDVSFDLAVVHETMGGSVCLRFVQKTTMTTTRTTPKRAAPAPVLQRAGKKQKRAAPAPDEDSAFQNMRVELEWDTDGVMKWWSATLATMSSTDSHLVTAPKGHRVLSVRYDAVEEKDSWVALPKHKLNDLLVGDTINAVVPGEEGDTQHGQTCASRIRLRSPLPSACERIGRWDWSRVCTF